MLSTSTKLSSHLQFANWFVSNMLEKSLALSFELPGPLYGRLFALIRASRSLPWRCRSPTLAHARLRLALPRGRLLVSVIRGLGVDLLDQLSSERLSARSKTLPAGSISRACVARPRHGNV